MIRLVIANETTRRSIAASIMNAPLMSSVSIGAPVKSRDQEAKFHAMIREIAKQAQHFGSKWDDESWKRLICELWS